MLKIQWLRIANRFYFTTIVNEKFIRPASLWISDHVTQYGTEEKKNGHIRSN
jgi:hypothetical protein